MAAAKKTERTRQGILDSYIELLSTTRYDKVTVSLLCKNAGIVRSTFYTYFSDIFDVIQTIEDNLISEFDTVDAGYVNARGGTSVLTCDEETGLSLDPPRGFREWFEVCERNREGLKAMLGPNGDPYFESKFRKQLARHVEYQMDSDGMPRDALRKGFMESFEEIHLLLTRNWLLHTETTLSIERICTIINAMRVGIVKMTYENSAGEDVRPDGIEGQ